MGTKFQPATRKRRKLRMALDGPAGAGKSLTALRFAFALGQRVAVIDSEAGSIDVYAGDAPDGVPFAFDVLALTSYSPSEYTSAIETAGTAGYDVIVIDSLSHAWRGQDGALELVSKKGGNKFAAWKDVTPMHNAMVEAILHSPAHVIATMRSKTGYVLETDANGKQVPRKVGLEPIQREGMEYEFDLYGSMDWSHILTVTKSRCSSVDGAIAVKPGAAFLAPVIRWLDTGVTTAPVQVRRTMVDDATVQRIVSKIGEAGQTLAKAKEEIFRRYTASEFDALTVENASDYENRLNGLIARTRKGGAPDAIASPSVTAGATAANGTQAPAASAAAANAVAAPAAATVPAQAGSVNTTATPTPTATPGSPPATNGTPSTIDPSARGSVTIQQLNLLIEQKAELFIRQGVVSGVDQEAAWLPVLAKRGVTKDKELSAQQANDLISGLAAKIAKLKAAGDALLT
jgi:hypothetical protein